MFDNIASIDAGHSSVRLLKAKRGFRNFEILSVTMKEYDLDLYETDSAYAVTKAINELIENEELSDFNVIMTFPSDRIILRNLSFPFSDASKISETIPYEAEENIPYPVDSVAMDFQMLPPDSEGGRNVIYTALPKEYLDEKLSIFSSCGLYPRFAGIEANAHLRCYEYFNSVSNENILVIDIGHRKTVINIISDSTLHFTRSINTGVSDLIRFISEILDVPLNRGRDLLREFDLDLGSFDSFASRERFQEPGISKAKMKKIHDYGCGIISTIIEEISITINAGSSLNNFTDFSRIIITGGGSNIRGVSKILSEESGLPVVFMPFLSGYLDQDIRSRFSAAFGNLLVYMNHSNHSINFLKGEYSRDLTGHTSGKYLLPAVFLIFTIAVFLVNIAITFIQVSRSQSYTDELLQQKYRQYFRTQTVPSDPVKEAALLLQKEQKELNVLKELLGDEEPFIPALKLITDNFQSIDGFDIRRLNFDGKSITIEGEAAKSADLENFKRNLLDSGEFETVSLNIRDTSKSRSLFTMTIKKKL